MRRNTRRVRKKSGHMVLAFMGDSYRLAEPGRSVPMRGTEQPQPAMCRDRAGEDRIPAAPAPSVTEPAARLARLAADGAPPSPARRTPRLLEDRCTCAATP